MIIVGRIARSRGSLVRSFISLMASFATELCNGEEDGQTAGGVVGRLGRGSWVVRVRGVSWYWTAGGAYWGV